MSIFFCFSFTSYNLDTWQILCETLSWLCREECIAFSSLIIYKYIKALQIICIKGSILLRKYHLKGRIVQPPKTGFECTSAAAPTLQQTVACQSCPLSELNAQVSYHETHRKEMLEMLQDNERLCHLLNCQSIFFEPSWVLLLQTLVLTLTVLVTTIDAQWEGMGDVGSARYELALLLPCPTIRVLSYSN